MTAEIAKIVYAVAGLVVLGLIAIWFRRQETSKRRDAKADAKASLKRVQKLVKSKDTLGLRRETLNQVRRRK